MLIAFLFQKGMRPFLIRSWLLGLGQEQNSIRKGGQVEQDGWLRDC